MEFPYNTALSIVHVVASWIEENALEIKLDWLLLASNTYLCDEVKPSTQNVEESQRLIIFVIAVIEPHLDLPLVKAAIQAVYLATLAIEAVLQYQPLLSHILQSSSFLNLFLRFVLLGGISRE